MEASELADESVGGEAERGGQFQFGPAASVENIEVERVWAGEGEFGAGAELLEREKDGTRRLEAANGRRENFG